MNDLSMLCKNEDEMRRLQALIDNNYNVYHAAKSLGISRGTMQSFYTALRARALSVGLNEKGASVSTSSAYSTMIKHDENDEFGRKISWIKTSKAKAQQDTALQILAKEYSKAAPKIQPKPIVNEVNPDTDLIPWFQIGDAHIGMLAHKDEVGDSFDLKIAEQQLIQGLALAISRAPKTDRCVIQDLGDMTHYENASAKTDHSGHDLDFDTRYPKMYKIYVKVMRSIIELAMERYNKVDIIINQGNHSRTNDWAMCAWLQSIYKNEPRITVLDNSSVFIPYRMGNVFVLCHHGDKSKSAQLAGVMANDFAQDWGETKYHYIDSGHLHANNCKVEQNGSIWESFCQMTIGDKWAHDYGYRSRKCMTTVLRSKTYGEVGRMTLTLEELNDIIKDVPAGTHANIRRIVHTV